MAERENKVPDFAAWLFGSMMLVWLLVVASELLNGRSRLLPIIAGFVFFQSFNGALGSSLSRHKIRLTPASSPHDFTNIGVSLLHSLLVSLSVGACVLVELYRTGSVAKMLEFESLYSRSWPGAYSVLAFSCGYFAYDQVDMIRRHLYQGWFPPLLVHHWLLLNCFTLALLRNVSINYLVLTLLCEMHSVFLHWRRISRMTGIRKLGSVAVIAEWILNWITYFTSRLLVHGVISVKLYMDATKFPSKLELLLASSGMLGLNVLNIVLGLDLCRACMKEMRTKKARA
ncbi:hypothetical protein SELMODRAFT_407236 [Selaginella moellendorffii]|uniref:TLC domain-containing protein n=1 Tax=Selaginella moellendorffii TaxID=88036 RepID=D8R4D3_SELML|nr:TLC domain-containing protein 2 [Selaginella moellendorffii]EFJ33444.1 hypothetical protein SELMODRAFT_407236 [Selaginella moellendorffii]|eukprot:XP_002966024.1 TLC domain-containing protein 2 [Selaginella moellendorffii]